MASKLFLHGNRHANATKGRSRSRERKCTAVHASALQLQEVLPQLAEGVGLPCSVQQCGDQLTQRTLDPELRSETSSLVEKLQQLGVFVSVVTAYCALPPKPAAGLLDYYLLSPLTRARYRARFKPSDFRLLGVLGEGSFGVVFSALEAAGSSSRDVVVKVCDGFGEEECWMYERIVRHDSSATPSLRATFTGPSTSELQRNSTTGEVLNSANEGSARWIVWEFEGSETLARLRNASNWPYVLEPYLFAEKELLSDLPAAERRRAIYRTLIKEIAECLRSMHETGLVHRDVKPENVLLSDREKRVKLIDLGGCCDLRTGRNYNPTEYVLDPLFSAPEAYALPKTTPIAPPAPLAMLLSPVLWRINSPDRFDSFSLGLVLLHCALPQLRRNTGLRGARRALERADYDIDRWRIGLERRALTPEQRAGLETLDPEAWSLLKGLLTSPAESKRRLSMEQVLQHPWIAGKSRGGVELRKRLYAPQLSRFLKWLDFRLVRTGTANDGGFTEAQLAEVFQFSEKPSYKRVKQLLGRLAKETISAASFTEAQGNNNNRKRKKRQRFLKWR